MSRDLTVTALIAAFNEEDIIGQVVGDLVQQGIRVHLLDNGSTDGTVAEVERHLESGLVAIERFVSTEGEGRFSWRELLQRKAALARELTSDWFIHHDADELRESPWPGVSLYEGIQAVDALGYNAIDFEVFNFWPTEEDPGPELDVRRALPRYAPADGWDKVQIKCWKRVEGPLELAESGGHEAQFPARRVFPLRFVLRHYPIRSQAHGERKVFSERVPRFGDAERAAGWHVQYDQFEAGQSFVKDPAQLLPFDPLLARIPLMVAHRGVEARDAELRRRLDEQRASHDAELSRQSGRSGHLENEVVRLERDKARLEQDAGELRGARTAAEQRLARLQQEVSQLRQQRAVLRRELTLREGELDSVRGRAGHLQNVVVRLEREKAQLEAGLAEERARRAEATAGLEGEKAALEATLAQERVRLTQTQRAGEEESASLRRELERRLEAIHQSGSWRITAPLRAAVDLLGKWRPGS